MEVVLLGASKKRHRPFINDNSNGGEKAINID
jgi:hypothetical protein